MNALAGEAEETSEIRLLAVPANKPPGFSGQFIPQRSIRTGTDCAATGYSVAFLVSFSGSEERCIAKRQETVGETIQGI